MCAAVNVGRFFQGYRYISLYKPMEHKHGHCHGKSCVHEDQSDSVVQDIQRASVNTYQRDHDRLERYDHGSNH